jgi:hypothetical protein
MKGNPELLKCEGMPIAESVNLMNGTLYFSILRRMVRKVCSEDACACDMSLSAV